MRITSLNLGALKDLFAASEEVPNKVRPVDFHHRCRISQWYLPPPGI
jgi:hypothetical protein